MPIITDINITIKIATIENIDITKDIKGYCSLRINFHYNENEQEHNGYLLYFPNSKNNCRLERVTGHFIFRCFAIAEVNEFCELKGKKIRVCSLYNKVQSIGHITKEDWFCPSDDFID